MKYHVRNRGDPTRSCRCRRGHQPVHVKPRMEALGGHQAHTKVSERNQGCTTCWGQGRQCGSKSNTLCDEEPAYERQNEIHTQREREIEAQRINYIPIATITNDNNLY